MCELRTTNTSTLILFALCLLVFTLVCAPLSHAEDMDYFSIDGGSNKYDISQVEEAFYVSGLTIEDIDTFYRDGTLSNHKLDSILYSAGALHYVIALRAVEEQKWMLNFRENLAVAVNAFMSSSLNSSGLKEIQNEWHSPSGYGFPLEVVAGEELLVVIRVEEQVFDVYPDISLYKYDHYYSWVSLRDTVVAMLLGALFFCCVYYLFLCISSPSRVVFWLSVCSFSVAFINLFFNGYFEFLQITSSLSRYIDLFLLLMICLSFGFFGVRFFSPKDIPKYCVVLLYSTSMFAILLTVLAFILPILDMVYWSWVLLSYLFVVQIIVIVFNWRIYPPIRWVAVACVPAALVHVIRYFKVFEWWTLYVDTELIMLGGSLLWVAAYFVSLAERMKYIQAQSLKLKQGYALKTNFLMSASHDLKGPLNTIKLLSASLNECVRGESGNKRLNKLKGSIKLYSDILDTSLDYGRLDSDGIAVNFSLVSMQEVLESLKDEYSIFADDSDLAFRVIPSEAYVFTDKALLYRIIRNLLNNAFRYTRTGKILLGCRRRPTGIELQVWDTGIGISDADSKRIFTAFTRVSSSNLDNNGVGLGLSIVSAFAAKLECTVTFNSALGKGSCFSIFIPYKR